MEHTEGLGRLAEVWVEGELLRVCDNLSSAARRHPPGLVGECRFVYTCEAGTDWAEARRLNPGRKQRLEPLQRWSYIGYGRVTAIMPVVVDFGILTMEDASWTTDESLVGQYVAVPIDRLDITHPASDWPAGLR